MRARGAGEDFALSTKSGDGVVVVVSGEELCRSSVSFAELISFVLLVIICKTPCWWLIGVFILDGWRSIRMKKEAQSKSAL